MPYYAWRGVNLAGRWCSGKSFAHKPELLDRQLFEHDIALISCKQSNTLWHTSVKKADCVRFLHNLATLLHAGVLLPDALFLLRDNFGHVRMQLVIEYICQSIEHGTTLADACAQHRHYFSPLMIQLMRVGQEVGALPATLDVLVAHLEMAAGHWERLRSALLMPLITLGFLCVVSTVIITMVVPTIATVLQSAGGQMPSTTQFLLACNTWLHSWHALFTASIATCVIILLYWWLRTSTRGKALCDYLVLRLPFVREIVLESNAAWFYQSLATLLSGGTEIVPALAIAAHSVHNGIIKNQLLTVCQAVSAGNALSSALSTHAPHICTPVDRAMLSVGESSATVSPALQILFAAHQKKTLALFGWITVVLQPLLLITIGMLVALLVIALYAPLFDFSPVW